LLYQVHFFSRQSVNKLVKKFDIHRDVQKTGPRN
jgi:hypothetical protein